jgi:hypothetical protein
MNSDSHQEQLKDLSARDECQEKSYCQKKKAEIQKSFSNSHRSDDVSLISSTMSEEEESQVEKNF